MYAAHDEVSIYGIGHTEQEALEDARQQADGEYQVSPIDPKFAAKIQRDGFDGNHDSFEVEYDGTLFEPLD